MSISKEVIRREIRARLAGVTADERERAATALARYLRDSPRFLGAGTILAYAAMADEIPLDPVLEIARARGARIAYPRCENAPSARLCLHLVVAAADLSAGRYGILEPAADAPVLSPEEIDFALVPGVAWCRRGTRLGRGAGFYDRLLGQDAFGGVRCGVFLARQEYPGLPRDDWDVPLDLVVTERELVVTGAG